MSRTFFIPPRIYTGTNALNDSIPDIVRLGKHPFIVTDRTMEKLGNVSRLTRLLEESGLSYRIYPEINSEPTDQMIEKGLSAFQEDHCDFLIALGGGSVIDSMKAIAMMDHCRVPLRECLTTSFNSPRAPMAAIPTTAGTGSETTMFTIINDVSTDVKMLLKGPSLIPDIAIIDPVFTLTTPKSVTANTGIDALCHAVEAYTSRKAQPLSDTMALSAIEKIFRYLPVCYDDPQNEEARSMMAIAATQAGIAFNNSSVTIIHGMSRPLGANFHIPHGLSNAVLVEPCLHYVRQPINGKLAAIARYAHLSNSSNDMTAANDFFKHLHQLLSHLNIPSLSDIIPDSARYHRLIDKMSADAMESGSPANTVMPLTTDDLKTIYQSLL